MNTISEILNKLVSRQFWKTLHLDPALKDKLYQYALLMRFDKPIGIFLLLWPTLWALWLSGDGHPRPGIVFIFISGVILMRAAGCVINDYADRGFDPHVERTRNRPIATGKVSPKEALYLFSGLCLLAFVLVLLTNHLTVLLAFVGVVLAASYPFMKRYTYLPQFFLGATFSWAIPMAYAAQTGGLSRVSWLLYIATVLWVTAYDTIYAMVDRDDDLRIGVKSTAILFAEADRSIIGGIQLGFLAVMVMVGGQLDMGSYYYIGLLVAALSLLYQQYLIFDRDPGLCFRAFLNNNLLGATVFSGIVLDYLLR